MSKFKTMGLPGFLLWFVIAGTIVQIAGTSMAALAPSWHTVPSGGRFGRGSPPPTGASPRNFLICEAQWVHFRPFLVNLPSLISSHNRCIGCLKTLKFKLSANLFWKISFSIESLKNNNAPVWKPYLSQFVTVKPCILKIYLCCKCFFGSFCQCHL